MEHEMRKEINKFKEFLNENSEEKLNISDVSDSDEMILTKREIINLLHDWERGMDWYFEYNDKTKEILDFIGRWNNGEYEIW